MLTTDGRSRVRLPDGRRLDVWQGGDPTGTPVLFFHGTPGGRLQAALGDGAARRSGVRLVAFSRPGYGGSTDAPTTLRTVADDAAHVMGDLAIGGFAVLGVSGGGPYALATAARHVDRVRAVAVVAGIGPALELDPRAAEAPAVVAALAGDVDLAVALQDAAATLPAAPPEAWSRRRPTLPVGSLVSSEVLEPWTATGRPGVPSYRGASRDALAFSAGWDIALSDVSAPVTLWCGDRDHVVGLEHGRWLHAHLPTSRIVVHEGAGHHATLMAHWADVLTDLAGGSG
ncbi:alpha/beta fold hydrolase [Terrabacter terrigena]|uniref:Alpha/beta fold hydrolase n=1 Tax=Terrabacter terrigena TaxID=574718 RepID=A0ABW3MTH3_9MICO